MTSVSLPLLLIDSLLLSVILVLLNRRGVGTAGAAAATLLTCVIAAVVQFSAFGPLPSKLQAVQLSLLFVLVPGVVVFGASRLSLFQQRPWWLLLGGPVSFICAVVVATLAYNIFFASGHAG
jgi:hypothetical protein